MGKQFLGRDAVFATADVPEREVFIPEWNGWVKVRGMTGLERDEFEADIMTGKGKNRQVNVRNLRAKLVARTVVNEEGERVFTEADIPKLGNKSAAALERIVDVARELSGLTEQDEEELLKNSENGQPDDSPSA